MTLLLGYYSRDTIKVVSGFLLVSGQPVDMPAGRSGLQVRRESPGERRKVGGTSPPAVCNNNQAALNNGTGVMPEAAGITPGQPLEVK